MTSNYTFPNQNLALFVENIFHLGKKISLTPGIRIEYIQTQSKGFYRTKTEDLAGNILENKVTNEQKKLPRSFIISGLGASYQLKDSIIYSQFYSNFTQNYRSVTFSDLRINNPNILIDSNLTDEKGYNFDFGYRTEKPTVFDLDISFFALHYNGRIGEILKRVPDPILISTTKRFRTNIADATIFGVEFFGEYNVCNLWTDSSKYALNIFGNSAIIQSQYIQSQDPSIDGNEVEYAPNLNVKGGLTYKTSKFSATYQASYTSDQFSDASNADDHPSAIVGIIPSYLVMDFSLAWQLTKNFKIESGINNLSNTSYFTKRTSGYPGPGILPSSGRNGYLTIEAKF
jgi:Fe(3+) dicitrate transport protein